MLQLLVVVVPCEMSGEIVTLHVPSELWSALLVRVKVRTDGVDPVFVPPLLALTLSFRLTPRVFRKFAVTFCESVNWVVSIGVASWLVNHLSPTARATAWPNGSVPTVFVRMSLLL